MSDKVSVSGPVAIESDARHRVAYDLMMQIARNEKDAEKDRKYWVLCYRQCLKAVQGGDLEYILRKD